MSDDQPNSSNKGMDPVLIVAIVLATLLVISIFVLIMCWKFRSKSKSTSGVTFSNPIPNSNDDMERVAIAKAKLTEDPFMLSRGSPLRGQDKEKFDNIARELQPDRISFLIILNTLRREAKLYTQESDAFYIYRECIHELSRFLHCVNKSPGGVIPEDGLYLAQWARRILAVYDTEKKIIAIPYNEDYDDEEEPLEGLKIQTLRSSMRARRRSSVGSSEESSLADSQIRVDVESEDEEELQDHKYCDVIVNPNHQLEEGLNHNSTLASTDNQ